MGIDDYHSAGINHLAGSVNDAQTLGKTFQEVFAIPENTGNSCVDYAVGMIVPAGSPSMSAVKRAGGGRLRIGARGKRGTRTTARRLKAPGDECPAGTHARRIFNRLLIDLSWNSSRLEGNTYSLLETERLLSLGEEAPSKNAIETQMILNHKAAIELLVEQAEEIGFNRYIPS